MTLLNDIQVRVEAEVAKRLPAYLLAEGVVRHRRHGHKTGCKCNYCRTKMEETYHVAHLKWYSPSSWEETLIVRQARIASLRQRLRAVENRMDIE